MHQSCNVSPVYPKFDGALGKAAARRAEPPGHVRGRKRSAALLRTLSCSSSTTTALPAADVHPNPLSPLFSPSLHPSLTSPTPSSHLTALNSKFAQIASRRALPGSPHPPCCPRRLGCPAPPTFLSPSLFHPPPPSSPCDVCDDVARHVTHRHGWDARRGFIRRGRNARTLPRARWGSLSVARGVPLLPLRRRCSRASGSTHPSISRTRTCARCDPSRCASLDDDSSRGKLCARATCR